MPGTTRPAGEVDPLRRARRRATGDRRSCRRARSGHRGRRPPARAAGFAGVMTRAVIEDDVDHGLLRPTAVVGRRAATSIARPSAAERLAQHVLGHGERRQQPHAVAEQPGAHQRRRRWRPPGGRSPASPRARPAPCVARSATNSTSIIGPRPRTSPTIGKLALPAVHHLAHHLAEPAGVGEERRLADHGRPLRCAAAQATGLPP